MRFLVESRTDLEGTLKGLGDITTELGDLVKDDGQQLVSLLRRAAKITPVVLKNQDSVEMSLAWLGVVGEGLGNAYHGGEFKSTDVRSNRATAGNCEDLDDLPIDPSDFPPPLDDLIADILDQLENQICPNPEPGPLPATGPETPADTPAPTEPKDLLPDLKIDCDEGVKKVKRQIRRIEDVGIPEDVREEIVGPLEDNLEELAKKCKELGDVLEDPEKLDKLLDNLPDELQDVLDPAERRRSTPSDPLDGIGGNAAGTAPVPSSDIEEDEESWVDGLMNFLGVS